MRRAGWGVAGMAALVNAALPLSTAAQHDRLEVATAVAPDTVMIGQPFVSVVRVMAPGGTRVVFHGVEMGDSVQPVDTVRAIGAAADSGATAAHRLVAWVAAPLSTRAAVHVIFRDSSVRTYQVPLALPVVRSVLPAGELPPPRPSRGVVPLPRGPAVWPWLLAALLAALAGIAVLLIRRRTPGAVSRTHPREAALAALAELHGHRDTYLIHDRATRILRRYLAALNAAWGEEWTTTELLARFADESPDPRAAAFLAGALARADRVKFAGMRPDAEATREFVARVRSWIEGYPPQRAGARPREAA